MKALVCTEPGKLAYTEIDAPLAGPGQAIIKIKRVGICGTDLHAYEGTQPFFSYPRILGHELAGDLVDVNGIPGFMPGQAVTVVPYFECGTCIACRTGRPNACSTLQVAGVHIDGGFAEYFRVPTRALMQGEGLSLDQLALVEPMAIGAHAVRRATILPGEWVLVIGAGPIGIGTMEMARLAGGRVIAMETNLKRMAFCREQLKLTHTIDANGANVLEEILQITNGDGPTVVMDATGNRNAINQGFRYVAQGGRYVLVGLQKGTIEFSHPEFHRRELTLMSSRNATREDFGQVLQAMRNKTIDPTTIITHRVGFEKVASEFSGWLDPANEVIKAMVEIK